MVICCAGGKSLILRLKFALVGVNIVYYVEHCLQPNLIIASVVC